MRTLHGKRQVTCRKWPGQVKPGTKFVKIVKAFGKARRVDANSYIYLGKASMCR